VPLDARKVAHAAANRAKITAGRSETVVLVSVAGGVVSYAAVAGVVWNEVGAVPAGVSNRVGEITRSGHDVLAEFPSGTAWPNGLRLVARTGTASGAGVAAAERFTVLDSRRAGLGVTGSGGGATAGNRWMVRLRRLR
jgi:hypothetical protein